MKVIGQQLSLDTLRHLVHSLAVTHRTTGLSPPEEIIYLSFEAEEETEAEKECEE